MYLDESVFDNVEFNIRDLIYVRIFKYKNKQVRNSVDIVGGKNIDHAYGILKNRSIRLRNLELKIYLMMNF